MAKVPHSFDFFHRDFLHRTRKLNSHATGVYLLFLLEQFDENVLPRNRRELETIGRCTSEELDRIWPQIEKFFTECDAGFVDCDYQDLFTKTKKRWSANCDNLDKRRENGRKGGLAKAARAASTTTSTTTSKQLANASDKNLAVGKRKMEGRSLSSIEEKEGGQGEGKEENASFKIPSAAEVREYCQSIDSPIDADKFCDFYSAKGWMVGRNKMKSWQAAARTAAKGWAKGLSDKPCSIFGPDYDPAHPIVG